MPHEPTNEREQTLFAHLESLQAQIDRLVDTDEKRLHRIEKLEEDRRVLRDRLDEARSRRSGLFRKPKRPKTSSSTTAAHPRTSPAAHSDTAPAAHPDTAPVDIPGVGVITAPDPADPAPRRSLRVATILDPFSSLGFGPEFHASPLTATGAIDELTETRPDLLLVESAYRGQGGSWATRIARFGQPSPYLAEVVDWCRKRDIPTVFWNKEDPVNYDWFISSAGLFDHVFTVDGDQIDAYRHDLGHDRVHLLQFFAQPAIHFPGDDNDRTGTVAFAGSYYAAKHPERRQQIDMVVDPARPFGLHIFDRHGHTDDERFAWPQRYRSHIVGSLTYLQTVEAYRRYQVFLNVNTVTDSPTMCARRVFELAACGTPVVSGPAAALANSGAPVWEVHSASETEEALRTLLADSDRRNAMSEALQSWVHDGHTASDRVDTILATIGLV